MSETTTINQPESKTLIQKEIATKFNPAKEKVKNLIKKLKNKVNGSSPDPRGALEEIVSLGEKPKVVSLEAFTEAQETISKVRQETEEQIFPSHVPDLSGDGVANTQLESPDESTEAKIEAPMTREEAREQQYRLNEVKLRLDQVAMDIYRLGTGKVYDRDFTEEQINNGLSWIAEDSSRVSEADTYIKTQEDIIDQAAMLPGLTIDEKSNINSMYDTLGKIRGGLIDRGLTISPHIQSVSENISVGPNEVSAMPMPTDMEKAYEYGYHATPLKNMSSIAENGLAPSGLSSKEPGTIFFAGYNSRAGYLPGLGMLFRTHISNIPEFEGEYTLVDGKRHFEGVDATRSAIPPKSLEYSLDRGKSWRRDFNKFVGKAKT